MRSPIIRQILAVIALSPLLVLISYINTARGTMLHPMFHKGMSYVSWNKDSFLKPNSDSSLKMMADIGTNCVAIIPTWYQEEYNSTEIKSTDKTPSDSGIRHAIRKAHEYGMSIMLKPHIDLENQQDANRSDIGFQSEPEWQKWFENYKNFITHYAKIAEEEGAEFFCVGTELSFAATRTDEWRNQIIPAVRKIFSGEITYAANWDEYNSIRFWGELDYAGIDAYFPLTKGKNPGPSDIRSGWKKWLKDISSWQASINKPVLFTEAGYCSADTAAMKPWEEAVSGAANTGLQADCYKAVFETFWEKDWFFGVYWWTWSTYSGSGGTSHRGFTPQNKPAMEQIKEWYNKIVEKTPIGISKNIDIRNAELEERLKVEEAKSDSQRPDRARRISFSGKMADSKKEKDRDFPRVRF